MGLKRLIQMGTILQIPQAGLAATDEKIKTQRGEVIEVLKAAIDGLDYTAKQREDATALIGKWMALTPAQAIKAYDSVKDTYSRDGVPTPEQSKAYIAMLAATAGLSPDLPAPTIFDFSLSAQPRKNSRQKNENRQRALNSPASILPVLGSVILPTYINARHWRQVCSASRTALSRPLESAPRCSAICYRGADNPTRT